MILEFPYSELPATAQAVRHRVRAFLTRERESGGFEPQVDSWTRFDAAFSRKCGEQGFIGMTWPVEFGGGGHGALERYVVTEELLAAGAPVGAHWIADRQSGGQILKFGSDAAKQKLLPDMAAGMSYFAIGMSEPEAGSDLAAITTRAEHRNGGWILHGRKVWTTHAHRAHYLIVLARNAAAGPDRHAGLTQFIVDLNGPGVVVSPIEDLAGAEEFSEVLLDGAPVSDEMVLGEVGNGWSLLMHELAAERSGPERFLSTYTLLVALLARLGAGAAPESAPVVGRLVAHLATLRFMSISVAARIAAGGNADLEAVVVKDVGTSFDREVPELARKLAPPAAIPTFYERSLAHAVLRAPSFSLRGGTREILRGIIARGLGLR